MSNDIVYTPKQRRPLVIFFHGGAGVKGSNKAANLGPIEGWNVNADLVYADYDLSVPGHAEWPGIVWEETRDTFGYIKKLNPTYVVVVGLSHGGLMGYMMTHHYTQNPHPLLWPADKICMCYSPTDLTKLDEFMSNPDKTKDVNNLYNLYLTGDYEHTDTTKRLRVNASPALHPLPNIDILMFHGDRDPVVSPNQMDYIPNAEKHLIPGAIHGFHIQEYPLVKQRIESFIMTPPGGYLNEI